MLPQPLPTFFFFNDTATTEIYTLSLHDALPILFVGVEVRGRDGKIKTFFYIFYVFSLQNVKKCKKMRSEEHTSELQSLAYLVCRLLLEKKKNVLMRLARGETADDHLYRRRCSW